MNESYRDILRDVERIYLVSAKRTTARIELRRAVWLIEVLLAACDDMRHGGGKLIGAIKPAVATRRAQRHLQHA